MKTSELTGAALDWAVSKCEGCTWEQGDLDAGEYGPGFKPSTDWAAGGPIIEREKLEIVFNGEGWDAYDHLRHIPEEGSTPLIAAMRCFVAATLGADVEVPDELLGKKKKHANEGS
jgi:hypothetical protein